MGEKRPKKKWARTLFGKKGNVFHEKGQGLRGVSGGRLKKD